MIGPDATARVELRAVPALLSQLLIYASFYATVNPVLFPFRRYLLPIAWASIWHASTRFYFSDPWLNPMNFTNCVIGISTAVRLFNVATLNEPPTYDKKPACKSQSVLCKNCLVNTLSYAIDVRCLHWHGGSPCHIPNDTRPDGTYFQFYSSTFLVWLEHLVYFDAVQVLTSSIGTHGLPQGDTSFRDTYALTRNHTIKLPHPLFSAVPMAFITGLAIRSSLIAGHSFVTLLTAPLVCLPASISPYSLPSSALKKEWPPLFDNILSSTSIRDFWSRRWHALFRQDFWGFGVRPGAAVGGYLGGLVDSVNLSLRDGASAKPRKSVRTIGVRAGGVLGGFLVSGLLHDLGMWGMGKGTDSPSVVGFFLIQAIGIILEDAIGLTKSRKRYVKGTQDASAPNGAAPGDDEQNRYDIHYCFMKLWTFVWIVFPATLMVDAWLRRGVGCLIILPQWLSPARALIKLWNRFAYGS